MFIASTTDNSKGWSTTKFDRNWAYSWAWGCWLLVLVGHPHHSPPLALHFKSKPTRILYPMPNPPTKPCCTLHQQFPLFQSHIFFNKHVFTFKIQRGNETCQFICCFFHPRFLMFIIHGKISIVICKLNLGHPPIVSYNLGIQLSPHLRALHVSFALHWALFFSSHGEN